MTMARKPRSTPAIVPTPTWRDQIALQVMAICMADTSRQIASGQMPVDDIPRAIDMITRVAYATADKMLEARGQ